MYFHQFLGGDRSWESVGDVLSSITDRKSAPETCVLTLVFIALSEAKQKTGPVIQWGSDLYLLF